MTVKHNAAVWVRGHVKEHATMYKRTGPKHRIEIEQYILNHSINQLLRLLHQSPIRSTFLESCAQSLILALSQAL
jgi:hypothetical protein